MLPVCLGPGGHGAWGNWPSYQWLGRVGPGTGAKPFFHVPHHTVWDLRPELLSPLPVWLHYPLGYPEQLRRALVGPGLSLGYTVPRRPQVKVWNRTTLPNHVGRKGDSRRSDGHLPAPSTHTLRLPPSWEGNCFELVSAGHIAPPRAGPLGLDRGFPAGPRNPASRSSMAFPSSKASPSHS